MGESRAERLIGIDGGATSVRFALVQGRSGGLVLESSPQSRKWPSCKGFVPKPLALQQAEADAPLLSLEEVRLGEEWIETLVEAILDLIGGLDPCPLLLGLALAGLKDESGQSIVVMNHGPRILDLLPRLRRRLGAAGIELLGGPPVLGSDGEDAVRGELYGKEGALRGERSGLVLNLGTGVAEGALLEGRVLSAKELRARGPAPFDAPWPGFSSIEDAAGLGPQTRRLREAGCLALPLAAARAGDERARHGLLEGARALAAHARARLRALPEGTALVLGGHLTTLLEDPAFAFWRERFHMELNGMARPPAASRLFSAALLGAAARARGHAQEDRRP